MASNKFQSSIRVIAFSIFKKRKTPDADGSPVDILYGAASAKLVTEKTVELVELVADSVPFHAESFKKKAPNPGFGILMLYGIRDSLEEMHYWRNKARELRAEFVSAEFEFEVGDIESGLTDRALLKTTKGRNKFLNVRRMRSALQTEILDSFTAYANADGTGIDDGLDRVSQIATRPDLFDRLLVDDRQLSTLRMLVIPVSDNPDLPGRMRQLAYVKPGVKPVSALQGSGEARIVLPEWMTNIKKAKELRTQKLTKI